MNARPARARCDGSGTRRSLYAKRRTGVMREERRHTPGIAGGRQGMARDIGGNRNIVRVVGRVVLVRMTGMAIPGPGVVMAVAMFVAHGHRWGETLELGRAGSGVVGGHGVIDDGRQQ